MSDTTERERARQWFSKRCPDALVTLGYTTPTGSGTIYLPNLLMAYAASEIVSLREELQKAREHIAELECENAKLNGTLDAGQPQTMDELLQL